MLLQTGEGGELAAGVQQPGAARLPAVLHRPGPAPHPRPGRHQRPLPQTGAGPAASTPTTGTSLGSRVDHNVLQAVLLEPHHYAELAAPPGCRSILTRTCTRKPVTLNRKLPEERLISFIK